MVTHIGNADHTLKGNRDKNGKNLLKRKSSALMKLVTGIRCDSKLSDMCTPKGAGQPCLPTDSQGLPKPDSIF